MTDGDSQRRPQKDDPFLLNYNSDELRIASEFLSTWLPFLSRSLCDHCTQTLSDRIRSLDSQKAEVGETFTNQGGVELSTPEIVDLDKDDGHQDNCDAHSVGSWKDGADWNDTADTNSLGSWKDGANGLSDSVGEISTSEKINSPATTGSSRPKMSWADMAQEDELEAEEEPEVSSQVDKGNGGASSGSHVMESKPKTELPREQREYIRFSKVKRKKDFICLERVGGKIVNILDGLELHTGIFSVAEQKRIVQCVENFQAMGKNGQLRERTYTAPQKWMRGKGRVTIQFGCCYNYAVDRNGNPPGILRNEIVDPIPYLFKTMIKRLVKWHVMPPSCVPDSCIVNIYEEGDCIPPHIDNHDFVRPFCTVSFLSECNIVFGTKLEVVDAGEFAGSTAISLPVGSVLVLNGNGADVAKHCVPAVPSKRISITFRRMDEAKRPINYVPESDLLRLQPLSYEVDRVRSPNLSKSRRAMRKQSGRRDEILDKGKGSAERSSEHYRYSARGRQGPLNRRRDRVDLEE